VRRTAPLALFLLGAPGALAAQSPPGPAAIPVVAIEPRRDSTGALGGCLVRTRHLMADGVFEGAMRNGFPVRFTFRVALWRDGRFLDSEERSATWDVVTLLDPVTNEYALIRSGGVVETFADSSHLDEAMAVPSAVELAPEQPGARYYCQVALDMESLSVSEVQEVERWLRGDLGRALTARGDVGDALSRGARLVLVRLSGLPHRRLETRTPTVDARGAQR
jgi:hypothetical protein